MRYTPGISADPVKVWRCIPSRLLDALHPTMFNAAAAIEECWAKDDLIYTRDPRVKKTMGSRGTENCFTTRDEAIAELRAQITKHLAACHAAIDKFQKEINP